MAVIIAERFLHDTPISIEQRYPGTTRIIGATDNADMFPLALDSRLQFNEVPFKDTDTRIEIHLGVSNTNPFGTGSTSQTYRIFGLIVQYTGSTLSLHGIPVPDLSSATTLVITIDRLEDSAISIAIIVDGVMTLPPTRSEVPWIVESWLGGSVPANTRIAQFPSWLRYIIVAVNTPPATYLGNYDWQSQILAVDQPTEMEYTDIGYIEDTEKSDPLLKQPRIQGLPGQGIVYSADIPQGSLITNVYTSAGTDNFSGELIVNGINTPLAGSPQLAPVRQIDETLAGIHINVIEPSGDLTNGRLTFHGERTIGYNWLCTTLGFTNGTLNNAAGTNQWLDVTLDSVHLLVPKISIRYNLNWNQIYAAGLVYGTDDFGLYPTGTPTNQLRIIEIEGRQYKVRLLKGADTDPYVGAANDYDQVGSRNSEWSRLFYPLVIDDANLVSYDGPKLASYTKSDLGLATGYGSHNLCQETVAANVANRVIRGVDGVSRLYTGASSITSTGYGWRPVLEEIQYDKNTPAHITRHKFVEDNT